MLTDLLLQRSIENKQFGSVGELLENGKQPCVHTNQERHFETSQCMQGLRMELGTMCAMDLST